MGSKTNPPKSEAQSHKPTFGGAAEKPGTEQREPEADPSIPTKTQEASDRKKDGVEDSKPFTAKESDDASSEVKDKLESLRLEQTKQQNPDQYQKDIHQPTTQDVLAAPISRPKTIDPATGQVHYVSDAAALPGGTAAKGGD